NMFPDTPIKGLPESEILVKMNARLAAEALHSMTARGSQLEFKTFIANNPGIMMSAQGTRAMIAILKQRAEDDIGLSREAMKLGDYNKWQDVEDKYYKDHPALSPFTGKPMKGEVELPKFNSVADVHSAVQSGKLKRGDQ